MPPAPPPPRPRATARAAAADGCGRRRAARPRRARSPPASRARRWRRSRSPAESRPRAARSRRSGAARRASASPRPTRAAGRTPSRSRTARAGTPPTPQASGTSRTSADRAICSQIARLLKPEVVRVMLAVLGTLVQHLLDVRMGLVEPDVVNLQLGAAPSVDTRLAGVVRGQRRDVVAPVSVEEVGEVERAVGDVDVGVGEILEDERRPTALTLDHLRGLGRYLHQPSSAGVGCLVLEP